MVTVTTNYEQRRAADAARRAGGYAELVKRAAQNAESSEDGDFGSNWSSFSPSKG
jgi:hypothetical protein